MPNRKQQIISSRCSSFGMMAAPSKLIMTMYLGAAVIGLLLLTLLMFKAWERKKREDARTEARRERRERRRNRLPPSGPQLSLTGWNSLRDKLLETEREFIEGDKKPTLGRLGAVAEATTAQGGRERSSSSDEEEGAGERSGTR
jgi:hypothetical protein